MLFSSYKIMVVVFLIFFPKITLGQNLVYNGGFEIYKVPKIGFAIFSDLHFSKGWKNPNFASPDSYHLIQNPNKDVAYESGFARPHSGSCYVGIGFFNNENSEYIQTKLKVKLEENKMYCMSAFFFIGSKVNYLVDGIGYVLSEQKIKARKKKVINVDRYEILNISKLSKNHQEWTELKSIYFANGKEKYLTIGNFDPNINYILIAAQKKKEQARKQRTSI